MAKEQRMKLFNIESNAIKNKFDKVQKLVFNLITSVASEAKVQKQKVYDMNTKVSIVEGKIRDLKDRICNYEDNRQKLDVNLVQVEEISKMQENAIKDKTYALEKMEEQMHTLQASVSYTHLTLPTNREV
eukprot:TRINITY_DN14157_c0_g2_i1.p1 TRINITY_DN14157_c0_g2~~TRINITY_DN14157_c0_g2_i1.p1  ORF type:complete len:130 (+),score=34.18 TRINITY_DN14157_c0_g2_i1:176-565(+)